VSFTTIFEGICLFQKKGFIHYDVKTDNILYNKKTNKFVFIDFGLSDDRKTILKNTKIDDHFPSKIWWNFPFENGFMNIENYKEIYMNSNNDTIYPNYKEDITEPLLKYNIHFDTPEFELSKKGIQLFLKENKIGEDKSHTIFVNKVLDTIDSYGLGIVLYSIASNFHEYKKINDSFYNDLIDLSKKMMSYNFMNRISIQDATREYIYITSKYK
jgi:serine/threonine protein kinase